MRPSRREFVKWVIGERHRAQPVASGMRRKQPDSATRETLPGRESWNPAAKGARPHRRRRQGHRREALRVRFPRRRSAGLAGEHLARDAGPRARRHACLHRHGPCAAERRAQAVGGGDRGRSRQDRHPRSRILCRRPVLPGRQDAALSGPAGRAADLRDVRRLRSGAAGAARRHVRQVRRGNRPGRDAELRRLSLHARGRPDARRARCLFADPGRLGQPGTFAELAAAGVVAARKGHAGALRQGRDLWRADPRRACREQSEPAGARPRIRDPIGRSDVPRAGMRARLVRQQGRKTSNSCSACSRPTRRRSRSRICSARPARRSSRRASTRSSPMSAAASAAATTRRSRSMSRWRRCSFPAGRSGSRTIAISSSRAASSATPSRCARGSASIARPARSRPLPPTMCSTAAASPIFRPASRPSARPPRSASTTFRRSTSPRSRCIRAA